MDKLYIHPGTFSIGNKMITTKGGHYEVMLDANRIQPLRPTIRVRKYSPLKMVLRLLIALGFFLVLPLITSAQETHDWRYLTAAFMFEYEYDSQSLQYVDNHFTVNVRESRSYGTDTEDGKEISYYIYTMVIWCQGYYDLIGTETYFTDGSRKYTNVEWSAVKPIQTKTMPHALWQLCRY